MDDAMIIFTRTYELLVWLLPRCERFPKSQRFVLTKRLEDAALDFQEAIFDANIRSSRQRLAYLEAADADLNKLRLYLRLAHQWNWLNSGQYEHASKLVAGIGNLLGGWILQTKGLRGAGADPKSGQRP